MAQIALTHNENSVEAFNREIRVDGSLVRIARLDGEGYQFLDCPDAALPNLRKSRTRIDVFTFIQRISDNPPKYEFPMEWDNVASLRVSSLDHWMARQIDPSTRNKIRKATKNGVTTREVRFDDALVEGISAIYNESPVRQGKRFWHYGKDLDTVRRMNYTFSDRSIFLGAFLGSDLIGFAKLVADETWSQAGLMQIVSMIRHRDKAPTNALIAEAVRSCAQRKIPYLWYANFSYGKKHDSLADFKRHNGFQKVALPRYYIPLTAIGRMALRFGLHREVRDRVPEPVRAAYRRIRRLWNGTKFPVENSWQERL
jgi:hypothetical protein